MDIPGYELKEQLGQGGFATVYRARHKALQTDVALKIMDPKLADDSEFSTRFINEGRFNAEVSNHPHIVNIYDIGVTDNIYFIAMQLLPGRNLQEKLKEDKPLQHPLELLRPIVEALGYAHKRGLVHRDLKPANILFNEFEQAVLSDFGIAKSLDQNTQFTAAGTAVGTPHYMSPEQAKGLKTIDGRSDLYSIGVILFELFSGNKPFDGDEQMGIMLQHVNDPVPDLPARDAKFQPLINKLMAKEPPERFESAEEVLDEFSRLLSNTDSGSSKLRVPILLAGGLSVLVAGVVAAVVGFKLLGNNEGEQAVVVDVVEQPGELEQPVDVEQPGELEQQAESEQQAPVEQPSSSGAGAIGSAAQPSGPVGTAISVAVESPNRDEVIKLLDFAQFHEEFGQFVAPPGSNALEIYREIIRLTPDNEAVAVRIQELEKEL